MRIVEVVLSLDIGGQERLVLRMAQAFHERGHDVHVVTLTPGGTLRGELGTIPKQQQQRLVRERRHIGTLPREGDP